MLVNTGEMAQQVKTLATPHKPSSLSFMRGILSKRHKPRDSTGQSWSLASMLVKWQVPSPITQTCNNNK